MTNTKVRHQEILAAVVKAIEGAGGFETIDSLGTNKLMPVLRQIAIDVVSETGCTVDTARRNIAKAKHQARYGIMKDRWGGPRESARQGRPPLVEGQRRQRVSTRLAPGSKELAQAIAEVLGLPGWGHSIDLALISMAESDQELKIKLAEMGIIIKANDGREL